MSAPSDDLIIATMKAEILDEVQAGRIPSVVTTFSQLHDYLDANELGGFTTDPALTALDGDTQIDTANRCQAAVDEWLASGEMLKAFTASVAASGALHTFARQQAKAHAEALKQEEILMHVGQAAIYFTPDMTPEERHDMKVWLVYRGLAVWRLDPTRGAK